MKRIAIFGIVLTIVAFSVFADGWFNARSEIQKSVQKNSPKKPGIELLNAAASFTNVNFKGQSQVEGEKAAECGCEDSGGPWAVVDFWSGQKLKDILDDGSDIGWKIAKYLLGGDGFQGFVVYDGTNLSSCPEVLDMGTYVASGPATYDIPLSFLTITTNASLLITVNDGGHLNGPNGAQIASKHGFRELTGDFKNMLKNLENGNLTPEDVEKILFNKPKVFSSPKSSFNVVNDSGSAEIFLESWWLRAWIDSTTPAGVYKDTIKITVCANVNSEL